MKNTKTETVAIDSIRPNHSNPRKIRPEQMERLKNSIRAFPKMLEIRPIVVDEDGVILGGTQRYEAAKKLGYKEVPVQRAAGLTDNEKREFMIRDNVNYGEWDEFLLEEFSDLDLDGIGLSDLLADVGEKADPRDIERKHAQPYRMVWLLVGCEITDTQELEDVLEYAQSKTSLVIDQRIK